MRRTGILLAAFAVVVLMATCSMASPGDVFKSQQTIQTENSIKQAQAEQELAQAQADHEGNRRMVQTAFIVLIGLLGLWGGVAAYNYHHDRDTRRQLDQIQAERLHPVDGFYPIVDPRLLPAEIQAQAALMLYGGQMQASIAKAQASAATPQTYSPHIQIAYPGQPASATAPQLPPPQEEAGPAALPDMALLADQLAILPRGKLAYGILPGGQPLMLPLAAGYHILAHGDTRSGKTNFIDGMMVQLHHQRQHYTLRIIAGDFKRELAATWRRSPLVESVETDPSAIAEMLEELVSGPDGILARYSRFERLGEQTGRIIRNIGDYARATGEHPQLTFMVLDEINAVLEACDRKDNLAGALKQALQTGAGAGCYILGGAQYLSSTVFRRDGSRQFTTRTHFGSYDQAAIRMMFSRGLDDEARELVTGQPGRGLIKTVQQAEPTPFQALRCDEADILSAIDLVRTGITSPTEQAAAADSQAREAELTAAPNSASESPRIDMNTSSLESNYPDLGAIIERLRGDGKGKNAIIKLVWGVSPGGSKAYQSACALYERI